MTTYTIAVDGGHMATLNLGVTANGNFLGLVKSNEFGDGNITGTVAPDGTLTGNVMLDGYEADFTATITGKSVSGEIRYGWFFRKKFTGSEVVTTT